MEGMKLIVGLGNPGETYRLNRHNAGFMFVEYFAKALEKEDGRVLREWHADSYSESDILKMEHEGTGLLIAKPLAFMNKSGAAVRTLMKTNNIGPENLVVAHDDLDIPLGKFRIVKGYGPKLHNGIESIENHLHMKDFLRVRIGVDNRPPRQHRTPGIDYVLQDFTAPELQSLMGNFEQMRNLLRSEYAFPGK
jgi:PTH1 family peptidyl-tRNA hydrolase